MNIKTLIKELQKYDAELDVCIPVYQGCNSPDLIINNITLIKIDDIVVEGSQLGIDITNDYSGASKVVKNYIRIS